MKKSLLYILTITALSAGVLAEYAVLSALRTPDTDEKTARHAYVSAVMINDFAFFTEEPDGGHKTTAQPVDILRYDPFIMDTSYSSFSGGRR